MSGAHSVGTKVANRLADVYHKAVSGIPKENVKEVLMGICKEDRETSDKLLDNIYAEADRYKTIRNIVLGAPWNKMREMLQTIIKDKEE